MSRYTTAERFAILRGAREACATAGDLLATVAELRSAADGLRVEASGLRLESARLRSSAETGRAERARLTLS